MRKTFFITILSLSLIGVSILFSSYDSEPLSVDADNLPDSMAVDAQYYAIELPTEIDFCGEEVPLNLYYVQESLDRELLVNCYFHSATIMIIKRANRYFPIIEPILKEQGIPDDFKYLAVIESSLRNVVSPAGAAGFWQFMKATAKEHGMEVNSEVDERYNLEIATRKACEYIQDSYDIWGNWTVVGATYNAGRGRVKKLIKSQGTVNYYEMYLNTETSRYIYRLLAIKAIMENPQKYGFFIKESELYPPIETYTIPVDTTVHNLPAFAKTMNTNYKVLKDFNPWLRDTKLPDESRKQYYIRLPKKGHTDYDNRLKKNKSDEYFTGYKSLH